MSDDAQNKQCLACGRNSNQVTLIPLDYRDSRIWICPQHLPILIHDPGRLREIVPGAESFGMPESRH